MESEPHGRDVEPQAGQAAISHEALSDRSRSGRPRPAGRSGLTFSGWLARTACFGLVLVTGSCAYTTSTALLPAHLKTIAIPVFENATTEYTMEQDITQAIINKFVQDNHLKVVDERSANAVLRGKITQYRNAVFGFSDAVQAEEYRVAIQVSVVLKDQVKNRELWHDDALLKTANYYVVDVPGQKARTELDGRKEAIQKIADEILSRTVEGW